MDIITSRDNAGVKYACTLRDSEKQRAAEGLFFAEGPKLCLELAKSCTPRTAYVTEAAMEKTPALESLRPTLIAPHVAEKLAGSWIAISDSILRFSSTPAFFRPFMKLE